MRSKQAATRGGRRRSYRRQREAGEGRQRQCEAGRDSIEAGSHKRGPWALNTDLLISY